jgi:hypothetical protein
MRCSLLVARVLGRTVTEMLVRILNCCRVAGIFQFSFLNILIMNITKKIKDI